MTTKQLQDLFYNYFKNKGYPLNAICGMMGNVSAECDWNPNLIERGSGVGYGLVQWSYSRRKQLERYGTSVNSQLEFLYSELTGYNTSVTGADKQWFNAKGYTFSKFKAGSYSPEDSASAFCWCFERPNAKYAHEDRRRNEARRFYNIYKDYSGVDTPVNEDDSEQLKINEVIESAVNWAVRISKGNHGYDQIYRWGEKGDYDCSSLLISAYQQAGIKWKQAGGSYTGNMKESALKCGFTAFNYTSMDNLKYGDVLVNTIHHTVMYIGNGKIVQASINEKGTATGGKPGDQTGREINISDFYLYGRGGWNTVLRYKTGWINVEKKNAEPKELENNIYKLLIETTSFNINKLNAEEIERLKNIALGYKVRIKPTKNKNKREIGRTINNEKLRINNDYYIIKYVRRNGFLQLHNAISGKNIKLINPKYVIGGESNGN